VNGLALLLHALLAGSAGRKCVPSNKDRFMARVRKSHVSPNDLADALEDWIRRHIRFDDEFVRTLGPIRME
jgi:hypothetical protein